MAEVGEADLAVLRDGGLLDGADDETALGFVEVADVTGAEDMAGPRMRAETDGESGCMLGVSAVVVVAGLLERRETGADEGAVVEDESCFVAPTRTGSRDRNMRGLEESLADNGTVDISAPVCSCCVSSVGRLSTCASAASLIAAVAVVAGGGELSTRDGGDVRSSSSNSESYSSAQSSS